MEDVKKALFLCHRDGLSHAGTTKFIFDDMAEHFDLKNVEPHCIITGLKPNSSNQCNFISGRITYRESFLKENFPKFEKIFISFSLPPRIILEGYKLS